jgi:hypothetical protein
MKDYSRLLTLIYLKNRTNAYRRQAVTRKSYLSRKANRSVKETYELSLLTPRISKWQKAKKEFTPAIRKLAKSLNIYIGWDASGSMAYIQSKGTIDTRIRSTEIRAQALDYLNDCVLLGMDQDLVEKYTELNEAE